MAPVTLTRAASNREGEDLQTPLAIEDLASAKVTLYQFNESPPCWKVRALLHYYKVEFESVVAAVYAASDVVLEEHFKKSREVVDSWYDSMHRQAAGSEYREYWPLGGHEDWLTRVMEIDAAWCTPGYTAPHAIITLLDRLTGCIVGACHVSCTIVWVVALFHE